MGIFRDILKRPNNFWRKVEKNEERLPIIREILEIKSNSFEVLGFDYNELDEMLFDACTS